MLFLTRFLSFSNNWKWQQMSSDVSTTSLLFLLGHRLDVQGMIFLSWNVASSWETMSDQMICGWRTQENRKYSAGKHVIFLLFFPQPAGNTSLCLLEDHKNVKIIKLRDKTWNYALIYDHCNFMLLRFICKVLLCHTENRVDEKTTRNNQNF